MVLTQKVAQEAVLPFIGAEEDLMVELSKVESADDAKAAVEAALKAGARPGCPAIVTAEKVQKAYAKDADTGKKARPKAPKKPVNGAGFDKTDRSLAITHDNSI